MKLRGTRPQSIEQRVALKERLDGFAYYLLKLISSSPASLACG